MLSCIAVDSGERRRLTRPPEDSRVGDVLPAFSPDGRTLAFSRYGSGLSSDLYLLDLDQDLNPQGEPRRRTFIEQVMGGHGFTSDGRDIVFAAGALGAPSLWRVPTSGTTSPERLPFGENAGYPQISRQGNRLAYTTGEGNANIYRLNMPIADGVTGATVQLISSSQWERDPQYSPDGKRIAFVSFRSGDAEIWKCDSDGSNPVQLTSLGARIVGKPRWGSGWEEYRIQFPCRRVRRGRRGRRASALDERSCGESVLVEKRRVDLLRVRPERVSSVFQDAGGRRSRPGRYSRVRAKNGVTRRQVVLLCARPQLVCPLCVENAG